MKNFIYLFLAGALALASCDKDDDPIAVGSISLDKTTLTLTVGQTSTLTATVLPENAHDKTVAWQSSNAAVATVSDAGLVTAISAGTATITATGGGKSATCTVTVEPVAVGSITLDKTTLTLNRGGSETLAATVLPDDAGDKSVAWSSDKPDVATVDDNGKVSAVNSGFATITATAGEKSATCTVTVHPDVYVVGHDYNNDLKSRKALLWKNGVMQQLPLREASSVFVADGDIYVAGNYYKDDGTYAVGMWKNGTVTQLAEGDSNPQLNVIYVSGSDVYVGGRSSNIGRLWKNGSRIWSEGRANSEIYSVVVSDGDLYMAGTGRNQAGKLAATYWKNEVPTYLTDGEIQSSLRSIQVVEGVVYAVGYEGIGGADQKAAFWKNGIRTDLPGGRAAYGMCVSDKGDVYAVGQTSAGEPALWKNGELTKLADKGLVLSVTVFGDDVYAVGYVGTTAVLWKNGVQTTLADKGSAWSIFLY